MTRTNPRLRQLPCLKYLNPHVPAFAVARLLLILAKNSKHEIFLRYG